MFFLLGFQQVVIYFISYKNIVWQDIFYINLAIAYTLNGVHENLWVTLTFAKS